MEGRSVPGKLIIAANQKTGERAYWLGQLAGEPPKSVFPYDFEADVKRRKEGSPRTGAFNFSCPGPLYKGLMKLSTGSDVKLHLILTAALMALLEKYTPNNRPDIIIGTPIYHQQKQGEYINTVLPLRGRAAPGMSFKDLLLHTRTTMVEASKHQGYPIEVLVQELGMDPYAIDFPLFGVGLLLDNIQDKKDIGHLSINLLFCCTHDPDRELIEVTIEYNPSLYKESTIRRISGHFSRFLERAADHLDAPLSRIDVLSEEEREQLLHAFNGAEAPHPPMQTIHRWFEQQVERTPDRIALTAPSNGGNRSYRTDRTYKELNESANTLARECRGRGAGPNTVTAVILEPSVDLIVAILAVLKAGGAYLPIDPGYPVERITAILDGSRVSLVLSHSGMLERFSYTALQGLARVLVEPARTAARERCDFDRLPMPDRGLVDYTKYNNYIGHAMVKNSISMLGSRGCPFNCAYCHRIWPKKHIFRSAENLFEEVKFYYDMGIRRFDLIDDIFNFNKENSTKFFQSIIKNKLDVQIFFPNGLRGDILTREYIDLMVEAGTINIDLALEAASPRLQKLIGKHLKIDKFRENIQYIATKYPQVILDLNVMYGFPSETEEEAMMSYDFIKSIRWLDFPYVFILKIHPNTAMGKVALDHGISAEAIARSMNFSYHDVPATLPFSRQFAEEFKTRFLSEYFLSKERLLHVLPFQMKAVTEDELVKKYDNYLPMKINGFDDVLRAGGIERGELGDARFNTNDYSFPPDFRERVKQRFEPRVAAVKREIKGEAFRVLLLDLSEMFSSTEQHILHGEIVVPHGIMSLMTYLNETFGRAITGKVAKSKVDFDDFDELKTLVMDLKPHLVGIRSLSFYKDFFHKTVAHIRGWGVDAPIIAGGPYATMDYKLLLQDPLVDLAVLGEGESTLAELVELMMANRRRPLAETVLETIKGISFIREKDRQILKQAHRQLLPLDKIAAAVNRQPGHNLEGTSRPEDLLYLISTSGSTGKPKNVMLEHRNMANLLHFEFSRSGVEFNRVLQFASIGFDVSAQEIFSTLLSGGRLFLMDGEMKSDLPRLFEYIGENKIEVLFLPPAFVRFIFSDPRYFAGFPGCVRHIITAGEQLVVGEAFRRYLRENGVVLHNHYGPSETHVVTSLTLQPGDAIEERPSIGKPISNTQIYILDETGNPKPVGAVGELYIAGANVGRGYANSDSLTKEKFIPDPFSPGKRMYRTGDLARWLADGTIQFIGRVDYQVKIRGFRIEPGEIERMLLEITAVNEALVIDRTDAGGDKYLCAYVVSSVKLDGNHLKDILGHGLPDYMIPAYIVQLDKMPLTPNGKIDRRALPEPEIETAGAGTYIAPRNEIETKLAGIWADILGLNRDASAAPIGIDVDFFKLGGHSLKATILISRMHKEFDVKMSLVEMFENPTIRELAEKINESAATGFTSIEPAATQEYYELSPAQQRLYVIYQMDPGSLIYNMPETLLLKGKVEKEKIRETFNKLIRRHESLRTSFHMVGGKPMQRVHGAVEFDIGPIGPIVRPFDLAKAPLFRAALGEVPGGGHLLSVDMHHIITDGMSMEVFIKDFMALYDGEELPPLRLQYKDFAQWWNKEKEEGAINKQEVFWLNRFAVPTPVLDLPADFPRPVTRSHEGGTESFEVSEEESAAIHTFARDKGVTMHTLMLVFFNIFLARLSGWEDRDIVVGTPVAGRRHADLEGVMGMFVNMLALRNRPLRDTAVNRFLAEVKARTLEAFENQDYPFEDLVDKVVSQRDTGRNPLFDTVLLVQDFDIDGSAGTADFKYQRHGHEYENKDRIAKFDLSLHVSPREKLSFLFEYSTTLFKQETIRRFISYFKRIISSVLEDPGAGIGDIDFIPTEEKNQLLNEFNNTSAAYPEDKLLHQLFEDQALRTPDAIVLIGQDNRSYRTHMSYTQLNHRSNLLAEELIQKGTGPETIVAVSMESSPELPVVILAILKAGGAYLPIDPSYPRERIDYMLQDSGAELLLTEQGSTGVCRPRGRKAHASNLAYVIYTSGTTGNPKGAAIEHRSAVNTLTCRKEEYNMSTGDIALQLFSFAFDGFVTSFFTPVISGAAVVLPGQAELKDMALLKSVIHRHRVSHFICVPSLYRELLHAFKPEEMKSLKLVTLAGEAVSPDLLETTVSKAPHVEISHEYGVTEAAVMSTLHRRQERTEAITIGKPIWNTRIYILDYHNQLQPIGVPGELHIAGTGIARGYINNPELTAKKFTMPSATKTLFEKRVLDSQKLLLYKTGDLAAWQADGNLRFLGRIDHQVKVRGFRIETGEIECRLVEHDSVSEAVVVDWNDKRGDTHLCAYLVTPAPPEASELKAHLSRTLPDYMIPPYFIPVERFPLTPNGKLDRDALPEPEPRPGSEYVAPGTDIEQKIAQAWKQVLGIDKIGIHDNFFDVGGNSVKILRLSLELKEQLGREAPVAQLFRYPTIAALARQAGTEDQQDTYHDEFQSDKVKNRLKQRRMKK
jgi:amino acid adenylation domain-containing protein